MHIAKVLIKNRINLILVIMSGIILCFMGFYNNYPLFHWDSAVNIYPAFQYYVPKDRPVIYGLFVRVSSISYSLWLTIFCQGIILSVSIFYYFKYLASGYKNHLPYFLTIVILSFFTSASFHVSVILPDFFTSIMILNLGLLFFINDMNKRDFIIVSLLLMLSVTVHNSHFVIVIIMMLIITACMFFSKMRIMFSFFGIRRLIYIWGLIIISFFFSGSVHYLQPRTGEYVYGHYFTVGQGGHVFMLAKLNLIGILKDYLDKNCEKKDFRLCEYKDSIPNTLDFIWADDSPLYKTGGWYKNKREFNTMIRDILTSPKYLAIFIYKGIESGFTQFFSFDMIEIPVIKNYKYADEMINSCYGAYKNEYLASLQNNNKLKHIYTYFNDSQKIMFFISFSLLIIILLSKLQLKYKLIGTFILIALIVNAWVCSSFSIVDSRYQCRVIWLLILPVVLVLSDKDVIKSNISCVLKKPDDLRN